MIDARALVALVLSIVACGGGEMGVDAAADGSGQDGAVADRIQEVLPEAAPDVPFEGPPDVAPVPPPAAGKTKRVFFVERIGPEEEGVVAVAPDGGGRKIIDSWTPCLTPGGPCEPAGRTGAVLGIDARGRLAYAVGKPNGGCCLGGCCPCTRIFEPTVRLIDATTDVRTKNDIEGQRIAAEVAGELLIYGDGQLRIGTGDSPAELIGDVGHCDTSAYLALGRDGARDVVAFGQTPIHLWDPAARTSSEAGWAGTPLFTTASGVWFTSQLEEGDAAMPYDLSLGAWDGGVTKIAYDVGIRSWPVVTPDAVVWNDDKGGLAAARHDGTGGVPLAAIAGNAIAIGKTVVFVSRRDDGKDEIRAIVPFDEKDSRVLGDALDNVLTLAAIASDRVFWGSPTRFFSARLDGSDLVDLGDVPRATPRASPHGWVAIPTDAGLFVTSADGRGLVKLTSSPATEVVPGADGLFVLGLDAINRHADWVPFAGPAVKLTDRVMQHMHGAADAAVLLAE